MLLGMTIGAVFFVQIFQQTSASNLSLGAMLAGMFVGMAWGMVLSVFLYRTYFRWRDKN
jgi:high-affinity Fe2+/Pb2+ permease